MLGDASKAKEQLGWEAHYFGRTVEEMVARAIIQEGLDMKFANKKVFVAGHNGMVGQAVVRKLEDNDC